jgi:transcriptional regulator with XRE-family HTH domain
VLTTGNQLKAARALIEMDQAELARRTGLSVNTIQNMERSASRPIAGRSANVQVVQAALEAAGIEFLNGNRPGVRLNMP